MLYLAGGCFVEGKIARASALSVSHDPRFRGFLNVTYDGRFFGLASSAVETALCEATQRGYVVESYHARNGEPVHLMRRLSDQGERLVRNILKDAKRLEALGLSRDLTDLCAEILSINLIPAKFALAYNLYLTHVLDGAPNDLKESRAPPNKIGRRIGNEAIKALVSEYFNGRHRFGVIAAEPQFERDDYVRIPFAIASEFIRERYSYLVVHEEELKSLMTDVERGKNDDELAIKLSMIGLDESEGAPRASRVARLFREYGVQDKFVMSTSSKLAELTDRLGDVQERGYKYIFGILEKIATFSERNFHDPDSRLEAEFIFGTWSSFYKTRIPSELRREIRPHLRDSGIWHFGLDYHVEHVPQFLERAYLLDVGLTRYVEASAKWIRE